MTTDRFRTYVKNRASCCTLCNPPGLVEYEQPCIVLERDGPPALQFAICQRCLTVLAGTLQHRRRTAVVDPRRDITDVMTALAKCPPEPAAPAAHCGCGQPLVSVTALGPMLRRAIDAFADGLGSEGPDAQTAFSVLAYEVLLARGLTEYCELCAEKRSEQAHLELIERRAQGADFPSLVVHDNGADPDPDDSVEGVEGDPEDESEG